MVAGGLLGGGMGVLGGGLLGASIVDDTCEGEGCLAGIIQGAFIGAAGVGIAYATRVDDPLGAGLLVAVPLAQITVSVLEHQ